MKIIAVDFDGCLCINQYPACGAPNIDAIKELIRRREAGDKVVLWTCRTGRRLSEAIRHCAAVGLMFDAINTNVPETIMRFGEETRKIYADEYWDDKAVVVKARQKKEAEE